jgi:hypothetical protein
LGLGSSPESEEKEMNAEKRKAFSFSLMAVGLMLLLIAMGLLCYNLWVAYQADQSAQEVLAVLDELIPETDPSDQDGTDAGNRRWHKWVWDHLCANGLWTLSAGWRRNF